MGQDRHPEMNTNQRSSGAAERPARCPSQKALRRQAALMNTTAQLHLSAIRDRQAAEPRNGPDRGARLRR